MLVVDPLKRITIQEIRQNPWFNVGLPEYLRPLPDTAETLDQEIDEDILSELCKVGLFLLFIDICDSFVNISSSENGLRAGNYLQSIIRIG
jgi:hypothetical protein